MSSSSNGLCRSVTGFLAADELGHIQCHEHIWLRKGPSSACNPALCMDDYAKSLTELRNYRKAGGASIIDAQPGFFGRDAGVLQQLSAESGVNIFAVTGFHKLQFLESGTPLLRLPVSEMASLFASEIEQGMLLPGGDRSDARAGFIKIAYEGDGWNDPDYSRLFSAAAIAARETGAPVMVHTEKGNDVLGLIAWLRQNGVDPTRLLICHLDRTNPDEAYHRQVLAFGCTLCCDSIHREKYVSNEQEISLIHALCANGYSEQLVLSLDTTNQRLRAYYAADMGLDYLLTDFISQLKQHGVSDLQIRRMCRSNASKLLQF